MSVPTLSAKALNMVSVSGLKVWFGRIVMIYITEVLKMTRIHFITVRIIINAIYKQDVFIRK